MISLAFCVFVLIFHLTSAFSNIFKDSGFRIQDCVRGVHYRYFHNETDIHFHNKLIPREAKLMAQLGNTDFGVSETLNTVQTESPPQVTHFQYMSVMYMIQSFMQMIHCFMTNQLNPS